MGSAEIWAALRSMVKSLQGGNVTEAQVLLDAVECTCPNGMLWRGVFDNRGQWYKIPEWIVIEPAGLVEENDLKDEAGSVGEDEDKDIEIEDLGDEVKVKCRMSNTGEDYIVHMRRGERVSSLVTKLQAKAAVSLVVLRLLTRSYSALYDLPRLNDKTLTPGWSHVSRGEKGGTAVRADD